MEIYLYHHLQSFLTAALSITKVFELTFRAADIIEIRNIDIIGIELFGAS